MRGFILAAIAAAAVLCGAGCYAPDDSVTYYGYTGSQPAKCTSCN